MTVKELRDALNSLIQNEGKGDIPVLIASTEGSDDLFLITNLGLRKVPNVSREIIDVLVIE